MSIVYHKIMNILEWLDENGGKFILFLIAHTFLKVGYLLNCHNIIFIMRMCNSYLYNIYPFLDQSTNIDFLFCINLPRELKIS